MAPAFGAVIATPERRDPTASAVARPVKKAHVRRAVITTTQSGGPFVRVPPASNNNEREDRSRKAETPLGLGLLEPVRLCRTRPQPPFTAFKEEWRRPERKDVTHLVVRIPKLTYSALIHKNMGKNTLFRIEPPFSKTIFMF